MSGKPHVLIVEDNPDHQELFFDAFEPHYEMSFSRTPAECLDQIEGRFIDLVLLDYYLQNEFAGLSLLRKIIARHPALPVIMVTAYGDEEVAAAAITSGAAGYVKKTLDNNYLEKLSDNITAILADKRRFTNDEKTRVIEFFMRNSEEFIQCWKNKIAELQKKIGAAAELEIPNDVHEELFSAFLADVQNESASLTLSLLKKMIWSGHKKPSTLLLVELLNTASKEAAREIVMKYFPENHAGRTQFMRRIGQLVDENDLELCKEYEKIVGESMENKLRMERISTKLVLMRTLQHEIRQPLTYIYNAVELLLGGEERTGAGPILPVILEQVNKIENLLSELEKDGETRVKDYSDQLPIFDVSPERGT